VGITSFSGVRVQIGIKVETEFGGDDNFPAIGSEGFADEFLVGVGPVDFRRIEESDPAFAGGVEQGGHLLFVLGRTVGKIHAHAAETDGGNFQITFS
jgi:hypothetical protein